MFIVSHLCFTYVKIEDEEKKMKIELLLFAVKTTILIHIEQSEKIDVKQTNKQTKRKGREGRMRYV